MITTTTDSAREGTVPAETGEYKKISGAARAAHVRRLRERARHGESIAALIAHDPYGVMWGELEISIPQTSPEGTGPAETGKGRAIRFCDALSRLCINIDERNVDGEPMWYGADMDEPVMMAVRGGFSHGQEGAVLVRQKPWVYDPVEQGEDEWEGTPDIVWRIKTTASNASLIARKNTIELAERTGIPFLED